MKKIGISVLFVVLLMTSTACSGKPNGKGGEVISFDRYNYEEIAEGNFDSLDHYKVTNVQNDIEQMFLQYYYYIRQIEDQMDYSVSIIHGIIDYGGNYLESMIDLKVDELTYDLYSAQNDIFKLSEIEAKTSHRDALIFERAMKGFSPFYLEISDIYLEDIAKGDYLGRREELRERYDRLAQKGELLYDEVHAFNKAHQHMQRLIEKYELEDVMERFDEYYDEEDHEYSKKFIQNLGERFAEST